MSMNDNPLAALEFEVLSEKATTLGRAGRKLEAALAELRAFDAGQAGVAERSLEDRQRRAELIALASEALWYLMVQRDACRLHNSAAILKDYGVPREVANLAGLAPPIDPRLKARLSK
jgi:Family of unknown function (DUF6665)